MADLENNLLQQASVDYLSQINRNVVALNSTAIAQKDISERQLTSQEVTSTVLRETKDSTMSNIQNQTYMAYGTFQHDMQGIMGVTNENARVAMSTMHVAGSRFVGDVMGAGQVVAGGAVGATAATMDKVVSTLHPGDTINQGVTGSILNQMNITSGSMAYTVAQQKMISQRQTALIPNRFFNSLPVLSNASEIVPAGQQFDVFASRFGTRDPSGMLSPILSAADINDIGSTVVSTSEELQRRGRTKEEATGILGVARQSEFETATTSTKEELKRNIAEFSKVVSEMASEFHMSGVDMANALKDIRSKTGFGISKSREFLENTSLAAQTLGYTPEESMSVASNALRASSAVGMGVQSGTKEYLDILAEVRARAKGSESYMEAIGGEGGIENRGAFLLGRRKDFASSGLGLIYTGAMQQGFNVNGGNLEQLAMGAAQNYAGGYLEYLKARAKQIRGDDVGKMGNAEANVVKNLFRIKFPDAKDSDLLKGGKYGEAFLAFVGDRLKNETGQDDFGKALSMYEDFTGSGASAKIDQADVARLRSGTVEQAKEESPSWSQKFRDFGSRLYNRNNPAGVDAHTAPSIPATSITPPQAPSNNQTGDSDRVISENMLKTSAMQRDSVAMLYRMTTNNTAKGKND